MVHLYGECCNIDEIKKIIKKKKIFLIEDAAQAHGAYFKNTSKKIMAGSIGDIGVLAFILVRI